MANGGATTTCSFNALLHDCRDVYTWDFDAPYHFVVCEFPSAAEEQA